MSATGNWPKKTREMHSHHFDSTIWNDFQFRDDDIIICDLREVRHDLDAADHRADAVRAGPGARGRGDVALARPARAAEGREAAGGRGADAPAIPQDASAGRCARLLAQGEVHLHRARRPRRRVELLQPPRERERDLVFGAERHARARRPADRARRPPTSGSTGATGWNATAIRSGRSGRTSAPGGRSAPCRTSCSCISRT